MYIISQCLLGTNCKYNGGNNHTKWVEDFAKNHNHIAVCPEMLGGLPCPRVPSEIVGDRVMSAKGVDVTSEFQKGADIALKMAKEKAEELGEKIEGAILKAKSPSCGRGVVYDGTFSGNKTSGNGVFAGRLIDEEIEIFTEEERVDG